MKLDKETLQARFAELTKQADKIKDKAAPVRAERDEVSQEAQGRLEALNGRIKAIEEGLFDIESERGMISRALGGKVLKMDPANG